MEKTIFDSAVLAVESGAKFSIDFKERSLRINRKYVIKDGIYEGQLGIESKPIEDILSDIERLYSIYKHSVPSEVTEKSQRNYFIALKEDELDDEDMLYGEHRNVAQLRLELYILCQILNGFKWSDSMGKWFYRGTDKDLIILREWIENNSNNN